MIDKSCAAIDTTATRTSERSYKKPRRALPANQDVPNKA